MIIIDIECAGKGLAELVAHAKADEEIVITKDDEPVARLVLVANGRNSRVPGRLEGKLSLPDSFFFDPLPEEESKLWSGEGWVIIAGEPLARHAFARLVVERQPEIVGHGTCRHRRT